MGVKETTTYTLVCDRCGVIEPSDLSPVNVDMYTWQFWGRLSAEGGTVHRTQLLLCGLCASKHDEFLKGEKTPRAARFNADEDDRFYGSEAEEDVQYARGG